MNPPDKRITPPPDGSQQFQALCRNMKGVPLVKAGMLQEALSAFDDALEIDPSLASSWYNRGYVLAAKGMYNEALAAFDKAIEINPRSLHPWNGRGYTLNTAGRYNEALSAFERAMELDHTQPYPWNGLGNAYTGLGRTQEALDAYNRAIAIDPHFAHPWSNKATLLDTFPGLETSAGHTAEQSLCRALFLRRKFKQRFPLTAPMLLESTLAFTLPLTNLRLLDEAGITADNTRFAALRAKTMTECAQPNAILKHIEAEPALNRLGKAIWSGIVNFYHGDPVQAFEHFDEADSEDETNIMNQFYLVITLATCLEPADRETAFALDQARTVLKAEQSPINQRYYAGLLFSHDGQLDEATHCFTMNGNHLPSLYMLHLCLTLQNRANTSTILRSILAEENNLAAHHRPGFLTPNTANSANPTALSRMEALEHHVRSRELESAIQNVTTALSASTLTS